MKPWKYILLLPGNLCRGAIPCGGLGPGDLRLGRKSEESAMKNVTDMCIGKTNLNDRRHQLIS